MLGSCCGSVPSSCLASDDGVDLTVACKAGIILTLAAAYKGCSDCFSNSNTQFTLNQYYQRFDHNVVALITAMFNCQSRLPLCDCINRKLTKGSNIAYSIPFSLTLPLTHHHPFVLHPFPLDLVPQPDRWRPILFLSNWPSPFPPSSSPSPPFYLLILTRCCLTYSLVLGLRGGGALPSSSEKLEVFCFFFSFLFLVRSPW